MILKYYNDERLSYSSRKRYNEIPAEPFSEESQFSVLLGDGATTTIKTSENNLCNYVTIDETRWFVTSYVYLNGGQIQLNLQRDVIGEFGLGGCFGKIERGYTTSYLRNRKELSLNQILKERKLLIPTSKQVGDYFVDTHTNALWGILYLVKPSSSSEDTVNVNIPEFAPPYVNYPVIEDGASFIYDVSSLCFQTFYVKCGTNKVLYKCRIDYFYRDNSWEFTTNVETSSLSISDEDCLSVREVFYSAYPIADLIDNGNSPAFYKYVSDVAFKVGSDVSNGILSNSFSFPKINKDDVSDLDYTNIVVKDTDSDTFYSYTSEETTNRVFGSYSSSLADDIEQIFRNTKFIYNGVEYKPSVFSGNVVLSKSLSVNSSSTNYIRTYYRRTLTASEAGNVSINLNKTFVDEPYYILAMPLYNVSISGAETFEVEKTKAFSVFNKIIEKLSGESGYLVDAQVYPYCPPLSGTSTVFEGIPIFEIASTSYNTQVNVQLLPDVDIKKEYITRSYRIVSPEQSGSFDFNFYDYTNEIVELNGKNGTVLTVTIKTALKPFAIIASAVINRNVNTLIGMTYASDMRGCQPSSNGFECSLASNAFETYKRQNSNYQQIFNLQKEELNVSHQVESVNEATAAVVNTMTATAMGSIGGQALGGGIGALAGGTIAGATVGTAMAVQYSMNEKLRDYEEKLQQQKFDLQIGTIKKLPNSVNRISSFNEIILNDFWFIIEVYECSEEEKNIVDNFIVNYAYGIGVFDFVSNYHKNGWFLRSTLVKSNFVPILHNIASNELSGGVYYYE